MHTPCIDCVFVRADKCWLLHTAPWNHIRGDVKRAVDGWKPNVSQSVSEAQAELDGLLWTVVKRHVKIRAPTRPRPQPWWTSKCRRMLRQKQKAFDHRREHPAVYKAVRQRCKKTQRHAFAEYNKRLSEQLDVMEKSDKQFWDLTKRISGLQQSRNKTAPSADDLVDHFASKMSNAAEEFDNDWTPPEHWNGKTKLSGFKIHHTDMLKQLKSLNTDKSINGMPYLLFKECANELHKPLTKLYRYICKRGGCCTKVRRRPRWR